MSTKALINIVDRQEGRSFSKMLPSTAIHTQIYKHYDGYPSRLGVTLAECLKDFKIVNGLSSGQGKVANGIGCLSAQLVYHIKEEPGNVYLRPPGDLGVEDYVYYIWVKEGSRIMISIFDYLEECIYVGDCESLIKKYEYNDE